MPVFADIGPLKRYPQFRRMWEGYVVTLIGSQLTTVAVAYEVYILTRSSLQVGLISLVQLVPALAGSVLGGSVADAIDRRKVLITCQCAMGLSSVALAVNAGLSHPQIWVFYVCAAVTAGFNGADSPTRLAMQANLVPREDFAAANTIRQLLQQFSYIFGPLLAGVLIAAVGSRTVFIIDVGTYLVAIIAVVSMKPVLPTGGGRSFGLRSIGEGFAYIKGRQIIQGCFVADLNATVFGMPTALFPELAIEHFHGGSATLGLLYLGTNIGSFAMASFSGWTSRVRRQGIAVLIAIALWGAAIIAFGLVHVLWLAMVFLAAAGAADVISAVFRNTIIQNVVPDDMRGRLSSINIAVINGGPRLGNFEAGVVGELVGASFSVVSGGALCILGVFAMARWMPKFRDYTITEDNAEELLEDGSIAQEAALEVEAEESGEA